LRMLLSDTATLTPACRPMANAACPTVPAGTSIGLERAYAGVAKMTVAASNAPTICVLIAKPFLATSTLYPMVARKRPEADLAIGDRA